MKWSKVLRLLPVLAIAWYSLAGAVIVEDLYTVELPVADQTTSLRLESFNEAFRRVLIKVSGSDDALKDPAFERPIERSARYVKQFRYINRSQPGNDSLEADRLYLRIDFDQQLVEGLLRENNYPVWGRERPSTLMVVSYDVNENIRLVSQDSTPDVIEALDRAAAVHAVPIVFPLMDLEDMSQVKIRDIVARQLDGIEAMARRYSPNALLVGQVVGRSGKGWEGDWEVRFSDQVFRWKHESSSRQGVIDQLVRRLARILAQEFALEDHRSIDESLLLAVSNVDGIGRLIKVQRYLESLNAVVAVRVAMVNQDVVTYQVDLRNDPEDLQRLIEFGQILELEDFPRLSIGNEEQIILNYSLIDRGVSN